MIKKLYPLKFNPIIREKEWGLEETVLGEDLNEAVEGFLSESELGDILETYMGDLVGDSLFDYFNLQFPLVVKTLDIKGRIPVVVHPDDDIAFERFYSYGKTEAWYIMEASPAARIYLGFKRDTTAEEFYNACKAGTVEELLNVYHPEKGDFFFIKPGTVHSAGGSVMIAQVSEPSELDFSLYDWGKEPDSGSDSALQLEEALDCIDYKKFEPQGSVLTGVKKGVLAQCGQFSVSKLILDAPVSDSTEANDGFLVFICVEGNVAVKVTQTGETYGFREGESILVPAVIDEFSIEPQNGVACVLKAFVPKIEEKDEYTSL